MTQKEREAMQQALEALEGVDREFGSTHAEEQAITALREALYHSGEANEMVAKQAEQSQFADASLEPVSLPCCGYHDASAIMWNKFNGVVQCHNCGQIYASTVRTKDLTDDEIWDALTSIGFGTSCYEDARAVISADREKNK